jgi:glycogen debranching enzyme
MDARDGLISAGDHTSQLTWMDAKRDGVVFTPRHGKPIEINALWCSSLRRLSLLVGSTDGELARKWSRAAERCASSINEKFWLPDRGFLADVIGTDDQPLRLLRPNQLWAIGLPLAPVRDERAMSVLHAVESRLLTPVGLRTLAPDEPGYQPRFQGNLFERDRAYHNGTVWPWLLGPFCEAILRTSDFAPEAVARVRLILLPLVREMAGLSERRHTGSLLSYPEVFDADEPRRPDGCPMQAWSVAEVIRVLALTRSRVV